MDNERNIILVLPPKVALSPYGNSYQLALTEMEARDILASLVPTV